MTDDARDDVYPQAFRDGYKTGYEAGIRDGRSQGYSDAKHRAFAAVEATHQDSTVKQVTQALVHNLGTQS